MKQTLQLKSGHRMAQTQNPKLQQRARLLGLSSTDLLSEIHEALESNVMLEFHDDATDDGSPDLDGKSAENTEQESVYERDLGNRGDAKETPNIFGCRILVFYFSANMCVNGLSSLFRPTSQM